MWKSRGNLQGYQFNAVIVHWKPFAYNLINDTNSNIIKAEGFVLDVMNYLKNERVSPQHQLKKYYPKIYDRLKIKQFEKKSQDVNYVVNEMYFCTIMQYLVRIASKLANIFGYPAKGKLLVT